jgi:hypothetical protein
VIDREARTSLTRVMRVLRRSGLLPFTDQKVPSLVSIVAGGPISGSWWGHPAGQRIYEVGESIDSDSEVVLVRLWSEKLTLVHRRLWPALVKIGKAGTTWQMADLTPGAVRLLSYIEREDSARSDSIPSTFSGGYGEIRSALRELDNRLLILTRSVHTTSGAHALEAESWEAWRSQTGTPRFPGTVASAEREIEAAAQRLSPGIDPARLFPWAKRKTSARLAKH